MFKFIAYIVKNGFVIICTDAIIFGIIILNRVICVYGIMFGTYRLQIGLSASIRSLSFL